jgi:hypothetical protein
MSAHLSQSILKRVALLAVGFGLNAEAAIAGLATIPEDVLQYLLSSDELDEMDAKGRTRVVRLLSRDPRASVRIHALEQAVLYERPLSPDTLLTLELLAADPDPYVRSCFQEHVAEVFDRLSIFDRTRLVGRWATSDNSHLRLALGCALQSPFLALGAATAIELLREDPVDDVRRQASIAGALRRIPASNA